MLLRLLSCAYLFLDTDQMHIFSCTNLSYVCQKNISMSCTGKGLAENVNSQLLISMSNGDISKGLILKKLLKLPSCKYHFASLKLPNSSEILSGFPPPRNVFMLFSFPDCSFTDQTGNLKRWKNNSWSSHLWNAGHDFCYSESSFPKHQEESVYYWYLIHSLAGWQTVFRSSNQQ